MTEDSAGLRNKVADWLTKSGYPLEMKVASLLREHGFTTFQSEYYLDREVGEMREIDVVGVLESETDEGCLRVTLAVECKASLQKPWVVFTSDARNDPTENVTDRAVSTAAGTFLTLIAGREDVQKLPIFTRPNRAGYAVVRAMANGPDVPYEAMMKAAKAANTIAWEASGAKNRIVAEIVLPAVVIDGKLFECYLGRDGAPILDETPRRTVYWRNPIAGDIHSVITVTTIGDLETYIEEVVQTFEAFGAACKPELLAAFGTGEDRPGFKDGRKE